MKLTVKKIAHKLHLWIGLLSGIVIFIVCTTGCLYVFKDEITDFTEPWRFVSAENKPFVTPSQVIDIANGNVKDQLPSAITFGEPSDAVFVDYFDKEKGMTTVFINPYDGEVIKIVNKQPDEFNFFRFILNGHRTLWLPADIGKPIVGWSILLFVVALITGIILWWPKTWSRKALKRNFTFRKKTSLSRFNFDLHNVMGGYFAPILIIIALTGLIWSHNWFSEGVYYLTSGGKSLEPYKLPLSDTLNINNPILDPLDKLYIRLKAESPQATTFYFALPAKDDGCIRVSVVHKRNSYYRTDNLFFDRYTLIPLQGQGPYAGKYTEASTADKLRRMNLEIHDGRIFGLFSKIIVFCAALIGASLPVTGVLIWYRKKRKKKQKG